MTIEKVRDLLHNFNQNFDEETIEQTYYFYMNHIGNFYL